MQLLRPALVVDADDQRALEPAGRGDPLDPGGERARHVEPGDRAPDLGHRVDLAAADLRRPDQRGPQPREVPARAEVAVDPARLVAQPLGRRVVALGLGHRAVLLDRPRQLVAHAVRAQPLARAVDEPPRRLEVAVHPRGAGRDAVEHALLEPGAGVARVADCVDRAAERVVVTTEHQLELALPAP